MEISETIILTTRPSTQRKVIFLLDFFAQLFRCRSGLCDPKIFSSIDIAWINRKHFSCGPTTHCLTSRAFLLLAIFRQIFCLSWFMASLRRAVDRLRQQAMLVFSRACFYAFLTWCQSCSEEKLSLWEINSREEWNRDRFCGNTEKGDEKLSQYRGEKSLLVLQLMKQHSMPLARWKFLSPGTSDDLNYEAISPRRRILISIPCILVHCVCTRCSTTFSPGRDLIEGRQFESFMWKSSLNSHPSLHEIKLCQLICKCAISACWSMNSLEHKSIMHTVLIYSQVRCLLAVTNICLARIFNRVPPLSWL